MKAGPVVVVVLLLVGLSACGDAPEPSATGPAAGGEEPAQASFIDDGFRYRGMPVHPLVIGEFRPWLSDATGPTVAVDLRAAQPSNEYAAEAVAFGDGAGWRVELDSGASIAYRWHGRWGPRRHVVAAFESGGGSGVFGTLFVLGERIDHEVQDGERIERHLLVREAAITLGDRAPYRVVVDGDRLQVRWDVEEDHPHHAERPPVTLTSAELR